ncbi:MAG: hypothetical protein AAFR59_15400, partial [Bacteroidota bacterium]
EDEIDGESFYKIIPDNGKYIITDEDINELPKGNGSFKFGIERVYFEEIRGKSSRSVYTLGGSHHVRQEFSIR